MLWLLTTAWLAACGRLGFDSGESGIKNQLPDAAITDDAPTDTPQPIGPKVAVGELPAMTATCGATASTYQIPLSNPGDQELVISSADVGAAAVQLAPDDHRGARSTRIVSTGSDMYRVLTDLPLTIPAGGSAMLEVQPPDAVPGTDRAKSVKTATLTLATNDPGNASLAVDLASTVIGANLDVKVVGSANPLTMNLNGTSGNCPAQSKVQITNTGNLAVTANLTISSGSGGINVAFASGAFTGGKMNPGAVQTPSFQPFTNGTCQITGGKITISGGSSGATGVCTDDTDVTVNLNITGSSSGSCNC